jgi:phospholipase D-like protein
MNKLTAVTTIWSCLKGEFCMTFNWAAITFMIAVIGWLIPVAMLFIVPTNRKPSSATAWLMLMFMLPYLGLITFLLLGSPKLSRRRLAQQRTMDDFFSKIVYEARSKPELHALLDPPISPRYEPFAKLNTKPSCFRHTIVILSASPKISIMPRSMSTLNTLL